MSIEGYYLLPHPPIVIPELGCGEEQNIKKTYESLQAIAKDIKSISPDSIIIVTPHGTMFRDALSISYGENIHGDLSDFGVDDVSMNIDIDLSLTDKIYELSARKNIPLVKSTDSILNEYDTSFRLDHGAIVPLYFINKLYSAYKIVHITYAPIEDKKLYEFGKIIKESVEKMENKAVFIASGDLSHRLKDSGPYDYHPDGERFDKEILDLLSKGKTEEIFCMDEEMIENAGECGMKSIRILLGALDSIDYEGNLLSYENTFGVGYGVMKFDYKK
ncbi:AmmeMemoRadiSam system protein B [Senegalia sp. (in: firmicutes)]|uniref:AmmeMemoRadiSam system protein B n=1 Tax=Senegalia sp. (in: firmicutes) TaxID=1924098 RepID=UPI003F96D298